MFVLDLNMKWMVLDRFHCLELLIGVFLLVSGCYDFLYGNSYFYLFALPQSIMYFAIGFELLGVSVCS
jgi:beta-mannan synthase